MNDYKILNQTAQGATSQKVLQEVDKCTEYLFQEWRLTKKEVSEIQKQVQIRTNVLLANVDPYAETEIITKK